MSGPTDDSNKGYYFDNPKYSAYLSRQEVSDFTKYAQAVQARMPSPGRFLDIGCGAGNALELLRGDISAEGVDISDTSIEICRAKGLSAKLYDGETLPFPSGSFDGAGSYNVLEHTDNPVPFLNEQLRVIKPGGFLIVACPNFLSVSNNFHWHTSGLGRKMRNLGQLGLKLVSTGVEFGSMATVEREDFHPDDDACQVTNPIDIKRWARQHGLRIVGWSSQSVSRPGWADRLDHGPARLLLGSVFMVMQKPQ